MGRCDVIGVTSYPNMAVSHSACFDLHVCITCVCVVDTDTGFSCFSAAGDGMMCQVRWGDNRLALYINNKRVNYMGLYQVSQLPGMVASCLGWWPAACRCTLYVSWPAGNG